MPGKRQAAKPKRSRIQTSWDSETELLGLTLELVPESLTLLPADYPRLLHAWFLHQIKGIDPQLSLVMHDHQTQKAFGLSQLMGPLLVKARHYQLHTGERYTWQITALNQRVVSGLAQWLPQLSEIVELNDARLTLRGWQIVLPPKTYAQVWEQELPDTNKLQLSFVTPTCFSYKQHYLPLPNPQQVFQSYIQRWNRFSQLAVDETKFVDWVDRSVVIARHRLESVMVTVRDRDPAPGVVTGFTGCVEFRLLTSEPLEFVRLFWALGELASYLGTGYKTPQGLGQTRRGWWQETSPAVPTVETLLAERIFELKQLFLGQRKQQGERSLHGAQTWATLLARRELGESLEEIAADLELSYDTAKSYVKKARKALRGETAMQD